MNKLSCKDTSDTNKFTNSINDEISEVYLALCIQNKNIGFSFYDAKSDIIFLIPDLQLDNKFETLFNLIIEIQPQIFVSTKHDYEKIKNIFNEDGEDDMTLSEDAFSFVTHHDISYNMSLRKIFELNLPSSTSMTEQEKWVFIHSIIPTESYNMVRSCGGLLKFLEKKRVGVELESEISNIPVLDVQIYTTTKTMFIDENSLKALNIFNKVSHPSGFKQGIKKDIKEGLSIFHLLNNCHSKLASDILHSWLRRPLTDVSMIQKRLDCVDFFQNSQNHDVLQLLLRKLKSIGNIKQILLRMKNSTALLSDWNVLIQSIASFIQIFEIFSAINVPLEIKTKIEAKFTDKLYLIASWINKIIDTEGIEKQKRFVVKEGVDTYLDEKKSKYYYLPDLLSALAEEELKCFNNDIQICGIVYLPQIGYLLTIPIESNENESKLKLTEMEYLFSMNNAAYYKNYTTKKLDKEFGDILYEIKDLETSIMHCLQESILEYTHMLLNCFDLVLELDCLLSLAIAARQMEGTRPLFETNGEIKIENGRHPLQEVYSNPFIPNSTYSNDWDGKLTIISGANGSGKSVYLKQIGILIVLAQIGSFVPATKMILTPQNALLTRLKSIESSLSGLSTFMVDLNQISLCCKKSNAHSTILIDEFGKGAEMKSGISLIVAFLRFMVAKKLDCPHIFLVTHFHRLFSLIQDLQKVQFKNFSIIEDKNSQLIYLYQLVDGHIECSHAIQAARFVNVSDNILHRAIEVSDSFAKNKIIKAVTDRTQSMNMIRSFDILKKFGSMDFEIGSSKEKLFCLINDH